MDIKMHELAQLAIAEGVTPRKVESAAERDDLASLVIPNLIPLSHIKRLAARWGIKVQS